MSYKRFLLIFCYDRYDFLVQNKVKSFIYIELFIVYSVIKCRICYKIFNNFTLLRLKIITNLQKKYVHYKNSTALFKAHETIVEKTVKVD